MYRLPFNVTILEREGGYSVAINKGFVHSCTRLDSNTDQYFDKDVTFETFDLLEVSEENNKIVVTIDLVDADSDKPFDCQISGVHVDAVDFDPNPNDAYSDSTKREIKIAEIDFSQDPPSLTQVVRSDIWVARDGTTSSSSDSSDSDSDSDSSSDSDSDSSSSNDSSDISSGYDDDGGSDESSSDDSSDYNDGNGVGSGSDQESSTTEDPPP